MKLISRQAGEGAYRAAVALYGGEEKARQLRLAASTKRFEGELSAESSLAKADAYETSGMGSALTGGASLFAKFGMGGYKASGNNNGTYKNTNGDSALLDAGITSTIDLGLA